MYFISTMKCNNICILPYQLGHGYKFYSFPYDAHFVLCRILFSINSSITKNVACYLIRQDEETKELIESEFLLYCALPSRV